MAKSAGAVLLWVVVALCLAVTILPHFLDRIYYRGAPDWHFDGERFFNPDGEDTFRPARRGNRARFFWQQATGSDGRPQWPERVAVASAKPAPRVEGDRMVVTWVGHATLLVQANGINILTDPIWSERAGPFGLVGPSRVAAPGIAFDDLPRIDLIVVSHNHYDHMDLATLERLWQRDKPLVVTSLGNDAVIGNAGVPATALDWGRSVAVKPGIDVVVTRNHHWGSRWFTDRNRALWSSFVVRMPGGNLFFAGDTGLGDGKWPAEAAALGPIRLAAIPIGAFRFEAGQMWTGSHIGPVDAMKVWEGLGRPYAVPIHWGTFRLSYEGWDTPPKMLAELMRCTGNADDAFAAKRIGVPVEVPALTVRPGGLAKLEACAKTPAVTQLP